VVLAVVVLTCLLAAGAWVTLRRSVPAGVALLVASAVWEPVNNRHLEGTTLLTLSPGHGVTEADLIGLAGWFVATTLLTVRTAQATPRGWRTGRATATAVACGAVFAAGAVTAFLTG
jgi:hypothetical protein